MKKSVRLHLTGSIQERFYKQYIKEKADKNDVKGFIRILEDGRVEIFIEGDSYNVDSMIQLCKEGHMHAKVKGFEQKPERLQDFKEFKILNF